MFIRCTRTRSRSSGEPYVTYRLVQTARVGGAVKQTTLLNLGSHFNRLYRASDALYKHREALQDHLFSQAALLARRCSIEVLCEPARQRAHRSCARTRR